MSVGMALNWLGSLQGEHWTLILNFAAEFLTTAAVVPRFVACYTISSLAQVGLLKSLWPVWRLVFD